MAQRSLFVSLDFVSSSPSRLLFISLDSTVVVWCTACLLGWQAVIKKSETKIWGSAHKTTITCIYYSIAPRENICSCLSLCVLILFFQSRFF
ncbi:hypothetical protein J3F83DRAFT_726097 [Trichoderma novae-zelandiae]